MAKNMAASKLLFIDDKVRIFEYFEPGMLYSRIVIQFDKSVVRWSKVIGSYVKPKYVEEYKLIFLGMCRAKFGINKFFVWMNTSKRFPPFSWTAERVRYIWGSRDHMDFNTKASSDLRDGSNEL